MEQLHDCYQNVTEHKPQATVYEKIYRQHRTWVRLGLLLGLGEIQLSKGGKQGRKTTHQVLAEGTCLPQEISFTMIHVLVNISTLQYYMMQMYCKVKYIAFIQIISGSYLLHVVPHVYFQWIATSTHRKSVY